MIEWRSANGDYARLPQLAADLVERKVDVIVADTTPATQAARRATSTIPIVMAIVANPVEAGLVSSLARPGGNVTGLSIMLAELSAKRLQLLRPERNAARDRTAATAVDLRRLEGRADRRRTGALRPSSPGLVRCGHGACCAK